MEHIFVEPFFGDEHIRARFRSSRLICGILSAPGQRVLETREEEEKCPTDNHIVVKHDQVAARARRETDTVKAGVDKRPRENISFL